MDIDNKTMIITSIVLLASSSMLQDICVIAAKQNTANVIKKTRDFFCLTLLFSSSRRKVMSVSFFAVTTLKISLILIIICRLLPCNFICRFRILIVILLHEPAAGLIQRSGRFV